MTKKIMLTIIFSLTLLFSATVCFAESENKTEATNLGNEITTSMDKTEKSIDSIGDNKKDNENNNDSKLDNVRDGVRSTVENVENGIEDAVNDVVDGARDLGNDVEENNTAVAGTTSNFASGDMATTNDGTGMSGTTWLWIILAVVAIAIIAAVWYYAAQRK